MADTTTTNYGLVKPEVGASNDSWGDKTNANWDVLDTTVKAVSTVASAAMPKAGGQFTGTVSGPEFTVVTVGGVAARSQLNQLTVASWSIGSVAGANTFTIRDDQQSADRLTISAAGVVNITGALTQQGNQVWHAGNFAPSGYAALGAGTNTFTGTVIAGASGRVALTPGGVTNPGYVAFIQAGGTRDGFIGFNANGGALLYTSENGGGHSFVGGPVSVPSLVSAGAVSGTTASFSGAITQGGNQVWHAGNFNPSNYATTTDLATKQNALGYTAANKAGDTFSGTVAAPTFQLAAGISIAASGGKAVITVGGAPVASIDSSGNLRVLGNVTASAGSL